MNRNNSINSALQELAEYLSTYSLSSISSSQQFLESLSRLYKPFHPLLVWQNYLHQKSHGSFRNIKQYPRLVDYYTEVNSDICHAILLFSQGMYKPGLLQLRSSIENFIKCIGIYENASVLSIKSVYDLFNCVKLLPIVTSRTEYQKEFNNIHQKYKTLCAFAHSKDKTFMSLTSALGGLPFYDPTASNHFIDISKSVFSSYLIFMMAMFSKELPNFHHTDSDLLLDNIPKRIKKLIYE